MRLWPCCVLLLGVSACTMPGAPTVDPAYSAAIEAWRAQRLHHLTADDGWLTLAGLHWLKDGTWRLGGGSGNDIALPAGHVADNVGTLTVQGSQVQFAANPKVVVTANGAPAQALPLVSDAAGKPTVLQTGSVTMQVIARGDALALRVRDTKSETRRTFAGLTSFAVDPAWRFVGTFEPAVPPRQIVVPTVVGTMEKQESPGSVTFNAAGKTWRLDVVQEPDTPQLFIVFADQTNGKQTYGTGRFLYADPPQDGKVIVDFNKAFNPPCAFTPFATCPLPPPQNRLALAIEAGEKRYH